MGKATKEEDSKQPRFWLYLAAAALGLLTALAAFTSPAGSWPLCIGAIACLAVANLDRVQELRIGKEGLHALLIKTERTVADARAIVRLAASTTLAMVQGSGRWGGFSEEDKQRYLREAISLLKNNGFSEQEIREIRWPNWDRYVGFDYRIAILGGSTIPDADDPEVRSEWEALREFYRDVSPDELRVFLEKIDALRPPHSDILDDFIYYTKNGEHRDLRRWASLEKIPRIKDRRSRDETNR